MRSVSADSKRVKKPLSRKKGGLLDLRNIKELAQRETREFPSKIVALRSYIVKYFIDSLSNRMNQKDIEGHFSQLFRVGFDRDVDGAGAEGAD
jgi:hypothetical protein